MNLLFEFEKETKGAARFLEVRPDALEEPVIGTLYVRKSGLKKLGFNTIPQTLEVSVKGPNG